MLLDHVIGKEGQERKAEEEAEVGPQDEHVDLFEPVDEVVMVDPVDAGEDEGEQVDDEGGEDGDEAGEAGFVRDFELEHHDGDDDGDDAVGEGFQARWGGLVRHGGRLVACTQAAYMAMRSPRMRR